MLALERQRRILEIARRDGTVRTTDLAREFEVTEETIRRDLDLLTRHGHLRRTHGGAMDGSTAVPELSQSEREALQLQEKIEIGREAAKSLKPHETILLDASSSALELAGQLPHDLQLRIVTYSLAVVERLASRQDLELIQLGGTYEPRGRRFSGMLTEAALRSLRIDRFFFSGGGIDPARGVSEPNPEQARLKQLMLSLSRWNAALVDHTKWGVCSTYFFAPLDTLHAIFTNTASRSALRGKSRLGKLPIHFSR